MDRPKPGEWLYIHDELGQTFNQYRNSKPISPDQKRNKIYLQPIGKFSEQQKHVIELTAEYLDIYFGLKTTLLQSWPDSILPKHARRKREDLSEQLLAPYILDSLLINHIPPDAIALMAVTEKDLYPKDSWNFVFGLASLTRRIGVSSIYRYHDGSLDSLNYAVCLERLIKTSSHEIGHMFGMHHCIQAVCVMNGSNHLKESDLRPNRLCSECLQKLSWNLEFDNRKRLNELTAFFERHKLKQDLAALQKDLDLIEDESSESIQR